MAKRPSRDAIRVDVGGMLPEETQKVPPKPKTRAQVERQRTRWGVPKTYRISPELVEAVDSAAQTEGVPIGDFVEFLLRSSLFLLDSGRITLPLSDPDRKPAAKQIADYPPIPDTYAE